MRNRGIMPWRRGRPAFPVGDRSGNDFSREFEQMLDRLLRPGSYFPNALPMHLFGGDDTDFGAVDVSEKNGAFLVTIDLPGVEEDDIDLEVSDRRLTVRASRERESTDEGEGFHHVERAFGSFARTIELPEELDPGTASASFSKGVLKVSIERSPRAKERTRKVPIGS